MRLRERVGRIAGAGAALALPFAPKCPLCLLPLAAAAGVALPPRPILDLAVVLAAGAWVALVMTSRRSAASKLAGLAAALMLLAGRAAGLDWIVWGGAAGMLASALTRGAACVRAQSPASSSCRSLARATWIALR